MNVKTTLCEVGSPLLLSPGLLLTRGLTSRLPVTLNIRDNPKGVHTERNRQMVVWEPQRYTFQQVKSLWIWYTYTKAVRLQTGRCQSIGREGNTPTGLKFKTRVGKPLTTKSGHQRGIYIACNSPYRLFLARLSWRRADATHTMPSTSRANSNSNTTASYTRAITPYRNNPQKNWFMHRSCQVIFKALINGFGVVPFLTLQIPLTLWRSRQKAWGRPRTNWRKGKLGSTSLSREEDRCSKH